MPRKRVAASKLAESKPSRRSNRHATKEDDVPEIYKEMLVEAAALPPLPPKDESRAAKRRRVEESTLRVEMPELETMPLDELDDDIEPQSRSVPPARTQQTIYEDFPSSNESDAEFEDVDLELGLEHSDAEADNNKPLQLDLSRHSGRAGTPAAQRRKPATTAEKRLRLDVHKWHVLCLMLHGHVRSQWCDREDVQVILKPLIPRKLITLLHLDESKPQYARNHAFNKAIEEISDIWQREWTVTAKGMRRAFWTDDPDVVRDVGEKTIC
jgi:xeroderma pigmentosum group C-complementing protein